jgi:hypothetical protein
MFEKLQSIKPEKYVVKQAFLQGIRIKIFLSTFLLKHKPGKKKKSQRFTARLKNKAGTKIKFERLTHFLTYNHCSSVRINQSLME